MILAAVVVLGPSTAIELFETTDVVGRTVAYDGLQLEVIGVLESVDATDANTDDLAIVPLSTYAQRLAGGTDRSSVNSVYVKATDDDTLSAAYQQAENLRLNLHGTTDPDDAGGGGNPGGGVPGGGGNAGGGLPGGGAGD